MGKHVENLTLASGLDLFLQSNIDGDIIDIWTSIWPLNLFVSLFSIYEEVVSGVINWPSSENQY